MDARSISALPLSTFATPPPSLETLLALAAGAALLATASLSGCTANTAEVGGSAAALEEPTLIESPRATTEVVRQYDEAPRTPDSDDPAIWLSSRLFGEGLVIGAQKDGGLSVYDLRGRLVQAIAPGNRPAVTSEDPPVIGPQPDPGTTACPESESGETFGRFNNVDVVYGVRLRDGRRHRRVDLAVVTDRGCDRVRIFAIDGDDAEPLTDITSPSVARVWPERIVHPWALERDATPRVEANPLDDQSTAYGLTLDKRGNTVHVYVTQRSRSAIAELELVDAGDGTVGYHRVRELRFDPVFELTADGRAFDWTPCREDAVDDPQFEGLVVDHDNGILYAAQEVVGIWKLPLTSLRGSIIDVPASRLVEPVRTFGGAYWAIPDDGEYECADEAPEDVEAVLAQDGDASLGGEHITPDAEGLAIYYGRTRRQGYLIASSQGDDTFHVFARTGGFTREEANAHLSSFQIDGVGETDGHDVVNVRAGRGYPWGLFVTQNGAAPGPASEDDINGYEYDGSTQFVLLGWEQIARPLGLRILPLGYDPRF